MQFAREVLAAVFILLATSLAGAQDRVMATLYKIPGCQCCDWYANYLRSNGLVVKVIESPNMSLVRKEQGVPAKLEGCHTTLVEGYVVEGHVPISAIKQLLTEKPAIKGISLPGMPEGSPGMTGTKKGPFTVFTITAEGAPPQVFAKE